MIEVCSFTFNAFQENTYVLICSDTRACAIIDPGCSNSKEEQMLAQFIQQRRLTPTLLLNTHCHIDHVLGNAFVMQTYELPLHMHADELSTYQDALKWCAMLGIPPLPIPTKINSITPEDTLRFGNSILHVACTPGHSIASLCFYNPDQLIAITGDVLFYESIGRTDLPGGDYQQLLSSIANVLFTWPDDMQIYAGHGPATTIAHEKRYNPFLI